MKNLKFFTLLAFAALLFAAPKAHAVMALDADVVVVEEDAATTVTLTKKQERKLAKMEKRMAKMEQRLAKDGKTMQDVDFNDPVKKWMWFWIFGWAAGIVIYIIGIAAITGSAFTGGFGIWAILSILGYLCWLFGSISLIIWLIKMFS
ncbi:MAG: hypothetical protein GYB31_07350 [Bacteroidetes bacterium]|nr:hypothetical protein [Bacteroidota bacterium]